MERPGRPTRSGIPIPSRRPRSPRCGTSSPQGLPEVSGLSDVVGSPLKSPNIGSPDINPATRNGHVTNGSGADSDQGQPQEDQVDLNFI